MSDVPPILPRNPLPTGKVIGDYKIGLPLGTGGMADVYYAIDQRLDRPVALKILRPALATDATYQQRFVQEAKAAASLIHPNIVQIYNVGSDGDLQFIAQEYIPGSNLRQYLTANLSSNNGQSISGHQLDVQESLSILLQILAALSKAAALGVVHRDIKPENIMLTPAGEAKVADFGLARIAMGDETRLTSVGTTLGTPMYMSPEQIEGGTVDVRSDLYSLGVTLFHMIYGQPPFAGDTPLSLAMQHVNGTLPDMTALRSDVPKSIESLIKKLLSKKPVDRFQHPEEVLDFLHENRKNDLQQYWPERVAALPGAALTGGAPMQVTQQLQTLLHNRPRAKILRVAMLGLGIVALWLGGGWLSYSLTRRELTAEVLFPISENLFKDVPRQNSAKQQYEWALVEKDPKFRFSKWESIEEYFGKSEKSSLNQLYAGLASLQLAREYREVGNDDSALKQLTLLIENAELPELVRALSWLELAAVEHGRDHKTQVQVSVEKALQLREQLRGSESDLEVLNQAVKLLPSEIELYWSPPSDS